MIKIKDLATEPSDRIDTTVSQVVVQQGADGADNRRVAINHVLKEFPQAEVLGIWRETERYRGQPVYNVEWADPENPS